ncbi:1472_t:CDS:2, partial [Acaulospora colombiana]
IPGIGRVSEQMLAAVGVKMCGDIFTHRATLALLDKHFHLQDKLEILLGLGSNVVRPWPREARKSVGAERLAATGEYSIDDLWSMNRTFHAIDDPAKITEKLEHVAKELEEDLERLGYAGHTVTLKVKLDTFEPKSVHKPVHKYEELLTVRNTSDASRSKSHEWNQIGQELLAYELPLRLRLIGLRVTNLKDLRAPESGIKRFFGQIEPEEDRPNKKRKLEQK